MNYFAYGANMDLKTLAERRIGYQAIGRGLLADVRLRFHMPGNDGTGKADIPECRGGLVEGVVYDISAAGMAQLDAFEGIASGHYRRSLVRVRVNGAELDCVVYRALRIAEGLFPSDDYLQRLLRGAETHGLSLDYLRFLRSQPTMPLPGFSV